MAISANNHVAPDRARQRIPLLPRGILACLFDLDGVLTDTSRLHAAAWKATFDPFLAAHGQREFDVCGDFERYVNGRMRADGVRSFLRSRGTDAAQALVEELADRKNEAVLALLRDNGVDPYPGSIRFLFAAREVRLRMAVVSSSVNAPAVLEAAGLAGVFDAIVDGATIEREGLAGKPAPDPFLAGARALHVPAASAAVFEDAPAGVEAGRAGHFGWVVGVDRGGRAVALREHGADTVVRDLGDLLA